MDILSDLESLMNMLRDSDDAVEIIIEDTSKAEVLKGPEHISTLDSKSCELAFNDEHSARQFTDIFTDGGDYSLVLYDLKLSDDVIDILERGFLTVEED